MGHIRILRIFLLLQLYAFGTTISQPNQADEVCVRPIDLCFVVDGSGSICDSSPGFNFTTDQTCRNWKLNLQFIHNIVAAMDVRPDIVRVGLVLFSTSSSLKWGLSTYPDKASLLNAIDNLAYTKGGTTDLTGGLNVMRTQCFGQNDNRPGVNNTAIIITDGYPTQPSTVQAAVDAAHSSGIRTFVVGVTDEVDKETLRRVSSPPQQENVTYFLASDYETVDAIVRQALVTQTCSLTSTPATPTPIISVESRQPSTASQPRVLHRLHKLKIFA